MAVYAVRNINEIVKNNTLHITIKELTGLAQNGAAVSFPFRYRYGFGSN